MKFDVGTAYLIIAGGGLAVSAFKNRAKTLKALLVTGKIALLMFPFLFLIFVLMGIIQAFIPQETISSWLGPGSGLLSIAIGEILGSIALIQPAAVFPSAGFLHQSGAGYGAIVGFVLSAMLIGISTLPLELQLFGARFTITRNVLTFLLVFAVGIIFMVIL